MFKIKNFIVIDSTNSLNGKKSVYSEQGSVLYQINSIVPVVYNNNCIGLARIKKLIINETLTTIYFEFEKINGEQGKVLYSLYLNNANSLKNNDSSDPYDNFDTPIPGAVMSNTPSVNLAENLDNGNGKQTLKDIYNNIYNHKRYDDDDEFNY